MSQSNLSLHTISSCHVLQSILSIEILFVKNVSSEGTVATNLIKSRCDKRRCSVFSGSLNEGILWLIKSSVVNV